MRLRQWRRAFLWISKTKLTHHIKQSRGLIAFSIGLFFSISIGILQLCTNCDFVPRAKSLGHVRNTDSPLVSVVLTTFNVQDYINKTLELVLTQSYSNLQIIVVDDGSSDNTVRYARAFERNDSRIEVIHFSTNTLGGVGTPANAGIDRAGGKYITFVDGDDMPKKDFISKLVTVAESSGADVVLSQFSFYDENLGTTIIEGDLKYWPNATANQSQSTPLSLHDFPEMLFLLPAPWRKLYTRNLLHDNNIRFLEGDFFFEDLVFHWALFVHAQKVSFVSESLIDYTTGRNNQTSDVFYEFDNWKKDNKTSYEEKGIKERLEENKNSMSAAKIIMILPILNHVAMLVQGCPSKYSHCELLRRQFLIWINTTCYVSDILHLHRNPKLMNKSSLYFQTIARLQKLVDTAPPNELAIIPKPQILLSIVVRTENVRDFLPSLERNLDQLSVSIEVIVVDDSSTDDTPERILEMVEKRDKWYLFHTKGGKPGLARNFGQLFAEGKYLFFLDSRDTFNATALDTAAEYAANRDVDVLMLPYTYMVAKSEEDGSTKDLGAREAPENEKWPPRLPHELHETKKEIAVNSASYAWNKLVRTEFVMREDVFHGPTALNEEVQHHWHATLAAQSIDFFGGGNVVQHRVFTESTDMEDSNDAGRASLSLIETLAIGNRVLVGHGINEQENLHRIWQEFCLSLVQKGRLEIAENLKAGYEERAEKLMRILKNKRSIELLYCK